MRVLFWITSVLSFTLYIFSALLFSLIQTSPEGAMGFILFLPMMVIGVLCGFIAALIRFNFKNALNSTEKKIGFGNNVFMFGAIFVLFLLFGIT